MPPSANRQRQLTTSELAYALRLPEEDASRIAEQLLSDFRRVARPRGCDAADISYRGAEVFLVLTGGRLIIEPVGYHNTWSSPLIFGDEAHHFAANLINHGSSPRWTLSTAGTPLPKDLRTGMSHKSIADGRATARSGPFR